MELTRMNASNSYNENRIDSFLVMETKKPLTQRIEEAKNTKPKEIDPDKLKEEFDATVQLFNDTNDACISVAARIANWGPETHVNETMKDCYDDLKYWYTLAKVRSDYEGITYCGCDTEWWLRRIGSIMDFAVGAATTAVLAEDTIKKAIDNAFNTNVVVPNQNVTTTAASSVQSTPSYWASGMIAASMVASKLRDHSHKKATDFVRRLTLVEELVSRAERLLPEMRARIKFWRQCTVIYKQNKKLSKRQIRHFQSARHEMKRYGGVNDPMYRIGNNLILSERPSIHGKELTVPCKESGSSFSLSGSFYHPSPSRRMQPVASATKVKTGYFSCKPSKVPQIKLDDLLEIDKRLTRTRTALTKIIEQANEVTINSDAHSSDYLFAIEALNMHLKTLKEIFSTLDSIPQEDLEQSKSSHCIATIVQTFLELSSLGTVVVSQYEETVGEPDEVMKIIGLTSFTVGFAFSRIRDCRNTIELNKLQLAKEVKRLNGLKKFQRDIRDLLTIFTIHQKYKESQEPQNRQKAFNKLIKVTKNMRGITFGMNIDELKQNLVLAPDANILCAYSCDTKKAQARKRYLTLQRRKIQRKILRKNTRCSTENKFSTSERRSELIEDSPTKINAQDLETISNKIPNVFDSTDISYSKEQSTCVHEMKSEPMEDSYDDSNECNSSLRSSRSLSAFDFIRRQEIKKEYNGNRNRTAQWSNFKTISSAESTVSETESGMESDTTNFLEKILTDVSCEETETEYESDSITTKKNTTTSLKEVVVEIAKTSDGESSEETVDSAAM